MDPNLFLIFSFILIIATIATLVGSSIHKRSNEHDQRMAELEARKAEAERGAPSQTVRKLEERVAVLERLATDRGTTLADEIEGLRDMPLDNGTPLPRAKETAR